MIVLTFTDGTEFFIFDPNPTLQKTWLHLFV
jgi:hypothetical protein